MRPTTIAFFLIFITLFSCKQAEIAPVESPISTFDAGFPKKNKNLARILGEEIAIKSENDTLILKIVSTTNNNLILNRKTGDTIFFGSVCKFRDFYYLNYKVKDSAYYISAFKIDGNLLYGLNNCWQQYLNVDSEIIKGNHKNLVKSINADTSKIVLKPIKQELRNLFTTIMKNAVPDTILFDSDLQQKTISKKAAAIESALQEGNDLGLKVYPNPATGFINVRLKRKSQFKLSDANGKVILQGTLDEETNRIDISDQKSGIYFLTAISLAKNEKETIKILIK